MDEWIANLQDKLGDEKRFVDLVVGHNRDVIDLEMGLPAYSEQRRAPRIDLLALEAWEGWWRVALWEVKLVGDGRARCREDKLPEVVEQLEHYTAWLSDDARVASVRKAYQENCRLLVGLHKIAQRFRPQIEQLGDGIVAVAASHAPLPSIDTKPRLMIVYNKKDDSFLLKKHCDKLLRAGWHVKVVERVSDLAL